MGDSENANAYIKFSEIFKKKFYGETYRVCKPHSFLVFSSHHHRPARKSSPG